MSKLLSSLLVMAFPLGVMAEETETLTMTQWHVQRALNVASIFSATCGVHVYTFTASRSAGGPRADTLALSIRDGATSRTVDLTTSALGQLLTAPAGFGELSFACRPQRLFVFYRGATSAGEEATLVKQSAVFTLSPEGEVSVPPPEGVSVTPRR